MHIDWKITIYIYIYIYAHYISRCYACMPRPTLGIRLGSTFNNRVTNSIAEGSTFVSRASTASPVTPSSTTTTTHSPHFQPVASPIVFPFYLLNVEVRLKPGYTDIMLANRVGIVRKISGKTATVHIRENSSYITIPHESLMPVLPRPSDTVKVIGGNESMLGMVGTLLSTLGKEALVQFLSWNNQRKIKSAHIPVAYLGHYIPTNKFCSKVLPFPSPGSLVTNYSATSASSRSTPPSSYPSPVQVIQVSPSHSPSSLSSKSYGFINTPLPSSSFSGLSLPVSFGRPTSHQDALTQTDSARPSFIHKTTTPTNTNMRSNSYKRYEDEIVLASDSRSDSRNIPVSHPWSSSYRCRVNGDRNGVIISQQAAGQDVSSGPPSLKELVSTLRKPQYSPSLGPLSRSPVLQKFHSDMASLQNIEKDSCRTSADHRRLLSGIVAMQHMKQSSAVPLNTGSGVGEEPTTSDLIEKLVRTQRDYLHELTAPNSSGRAMFACWLCACVVMC